MLQLLQTLQSGTGQDAEHLADACGVSRRTVFRDLESLKRAGVPVAFDTDGRRYRIDSDHFLPPTNLTVNEALAVLLLAADSEHLGSDPLRRAAGDAAAKIEASLPESMRERLAEIRAGVTLKPEATNPLTGKDEVYRLLLRANEVRRRVEVRYDCQTEYEQYATTLDPYHLLFHRRSWYVIGMSSHHKEVRTFNVGRIVSAEMLKTEFRIPRTFSVASYLGNAWRIMPGPEFAVHLRFEPLVAKNVSEVLWHATQQCDFAPDGTLDFRATVAGLSEIVWWVLGYGDQVEVLAPMRLRKMVAERTRRAAGRYHDV
ncbi:HTH domain protein [Botrimarina hoheduenensis]|uniref:HTH domain protein n=1 Tax=Botrimarina hoheduenensis TaxID=2528000 RepID=A0A5C5WBP6_9BACT|nr:HTH domain protein [Botrimarina hoheduenensis]